MQPAERVDILVLGCGKNEQIDRSPSVRPLLRPRLVHERMTRAPRIKSAQGVNMALPLSRLLHPTE
jgi:hypothetical protein